MGDELRKDLETLLQLLSLDTKELNERLPKLLGVKHLKFKGERNYSAKDLIQRFQKDKKE